MYKSGSWKARTICGELNKELTKVRGLPWWFSGKESTCQWRRHEFNPWSGTIPHTVEQLSQYTATFEPML